MLTTLHYTTLQYKGHEMIDYKATGRLLGSMETGQTVDGEMMYVVLTTTDSDAHPYCVSRYINGQPLWLQGTYFATKRRALVFFTDKCDEYVDCS